MLFDIWGNRLLFCMFEKPRYIFPDNSSLGIHTYIHEVITFSENYYRQPLASQEKKRMHIEALIILPSLKCAIALLLYSLAFSSFSLQFILIPLV